MAFRGLCSNVAAASSHSPSSHLWLFLFAHYTLKSRPSVNRHFVGSRCCEGPVNGRRGVATTTSHDDKSPTPVFATKPFSRPTAGGISQQTCKTAEPPDVQRFVKEAYTPSKLPTSTPPDKSSKPESPTPKVDSTSPRPTRSKLRPRKAAMTLTAGAVQRLRQLLNLPEPKFIRVGVKNRGCSGLAYNLEYVDSPGIFDETVEQEGVKVLVDSKALFSIIGSEMDWVEDKLEQRFVFRNPNVKEQCGCGESFMV